MIELRNGEYEIYTSKNGIDYQVQNKAGKIVMARLNSVYGFKVQKASKEILSRFKAV